ncbi:cupin domain-containing protein [Kutzneria sp. 744]|uniref:(R)-mandelonitrile lyase n=1 Tax=Kutzneria sp. (strain 744) TaxID=345341 RepID=UPI0003EEAABE|nr:cupin domain-containing protein [Kutzneria sp. 744]EWM19336.1 cupin [Kutzneria sp. 744]
MRIIRNGLETLSGQSDWFAGPVYLDVIGTPSPTSRIMGGVVHFAPGARTAWHTHPVGQTIFVTEGVGLIQREGGTVEQVRPGDRVHIEPGENHWHGATPGCFHTQVAYQEADDTGSHTEWGRHVTDDECAG